ncbi:MAG: DNA-3-methyladenine glycosylase I [Acidimicrobiales bacterium]
MAESVFRCWGGPSDPMGAYHDGEWGRPVTSEAGLFERVCLEAFQAGLSWSLVLSRREALRAALAGFDVQALARMGPADVERLLGAEGMIRNRAKLSATLSNARATLALREAGSSLPALIWSHRPAPLPAPSGREQVRSDCAEARALAAGLRARGFRFVGPTTAYALMQAAGLVNDHLLGCFVREEVDAAQREAARVLGVAAASAQAQESRGPTTS